MKTTRNYEKVLVEWELSLINAVELRGQIPTVSIKRPAYARTPDFIDVAYMAKHWDDALCGELLVSYRNNAFYVVDGLKRLEAAKLIRKETVPCRVIIY